MAAAAARRRAARRLRPRVRRARGSAARSGRARPLPQAMDDDLGHPGRRGQSLSSCIRAARTETGERAGPLAAAVFTIFEDALGLPLQQRRRRSCHPSALAKARARDEARAAKDWARADSPASRAAGRRLDCRGRAGRDHNSPGRQFSSERLREDTAVRREGDAWTADLQPRWNVGNNPTAATCWPSRSGPCREEAGRPDPVTVTAHYLSPPSEGLVSVRTRTVKSGRTFATVMAEVVQTDRERVRVLGAFGDLSPASGPDPHQRPPARHSASRRVREPGPPDPPGGAAHPRGHEPLRPPVARRTAPGAGPETGDPFEITGWIRFRDGTEPSACRRSPSPTPFRRPCWGRSIRAGCRPSS